MARINGSSSKNGYLFYGEFTEIIPNDYLTTNKTNLEYKIYIQNQGVRFNSNNWTKSVTIAGTEVYRETGQNINTTTVGFNDALLVINGVVNGIEHNADGKKTIDVSASLTKTSPGTYDPGNCSLSGQVVLKTIPRTSSVSCAGGNIESQTSINISRANDTFTHTLRYDFGNLKNQTIVNKTPLTEYPWTLPTSLYAQIPNAKSGTGTIYCDTYSGNTKIGTSQTTFTAKTVESKCKPTITATITDTNKTLSTGYTIQNLTGSTANTTLIKNVSDATVVITATPKNSATIKSYKAVNSGKTYTTATSTFANITSNSFVLSATDSRGYSNSLTKTATIINYIPLSVNSFSFYRPEPTTGEIKLTYKGNYFNGSFGAQNNSLTVKYRYKESTSSTWGAYKTFTSTISGNTYSLTISLGTTFDYKKSYDFQLVVTDKIQSITKKQTVSRGTPTFFMGQDRVEVNGGTYINDGVLQTDISRYFEVGGGLDLRNSDVVRANGIYLADEATGFEGINFLKENGNYLVQTDYETLRGYRGKLYYDDKQMLSVDDLYYKSGDTYSISGTTGFAGWLTGSSTSLNFSITFPKSLKNITSFTISNLSLTVRHVGGGYLYNNVDTTDLFTVAKTGEYTVNFNYIAPTAFSGTNNTPLSVVINKLTLTFN